MTRKSPWFGLVCGASIFVATVVGGPATAEESPRANCATTTWPGTHSGRLKFSLRCNFPYTELRLNPSTEVADVQTLMTIKHGDRQPGIEFATCQAVAGGGRIACSGVLRPTVKAIGSFSADQRCEIRTRFWVFGQGQSKPVYDSGAKKPLGC